MKTRLYTSSGKEAALVKTVVVGCFWGRRGEVGACVRCFCHVTVKSQSGHSQVNYFDMFS